MKYVPAHKLIAEIERRILQEQSFEDGGAEYGYKCALKDIKRFIDSLQQEQPNNMIQWTGSNLQEVIDFTGKSPKFGEWFKSWDEFKFYVHSHGDILKLFSEDGSHFEVPVGAWIIKTPDGHNVPSVARFIHAKQEQPELPGYDKALLEVKSKVDELYKEASIGLNEYDSGLYNGIAETCMKLRGFIKARLGSGERPEVDLEKEIARFALNGGTGDNTPTIGETARHFYGIRNRALEEAARHVYESWNGGTMDDVRRDMAELGKVLNARKE